MDDAMNAVDGYTFTYGGCVSLDLSGGRQHLEVDLGQRHLIHVVNIYHKSVRKYVFCHFSLPLIPSKLSQPYQSRDISPGKRVPDDDGFLECMIQQCETSVGRAINNALFWQGKCVRA